MVNQSEMTDIGLEAAMNDRFINDLNKEIDRMTEDQKKFKMDYTDQRLFFLSKHYLEIEIEKRKLRLKIDKIKIQIDKFHELRITMVHEASQIIAFVASVEEKMNKIVFNYNSNNNQSDHLQELMNKELKLSIEKLYLLEPEIRTMEAWIYQTKMRNMRIKDITITYTGEVIQFSDEKSSDNEETTYEYNCKMIRSAYDKSFYMVSFKKLKKAQEDWEQKKANGLNYAKSPNILSRSVEQYWHLKSKPCDAVRKREQEEHRGVHLTLMLPESSGFEWRVDGRKWRVDQWPLTLQIYSLKLTPCCSDDDQEDYSVDVFGEIALLGHEPEPGSYSVCRVKRQTLTKKDPYLLLNDPTFIPLPRSSCPPTIHAKLVLRGSDEPDKLFTLSDEVEFDHFHAHATRSKEVVDEVYMSGKEFSEGTSALSKHVNLGTGKRYMLRLTHGIVVNTIVANISVHLLDPSILDSLGGKCKISASDKQNRLMRVVLVNSKTVPLTFDDDDKGCLQLLRPRICVDFFSTLTFYIKCFGTCAYLEFNPRDCYRHDNCEHKVALEGIKVEVKWSSRETFPGLN